MAFQLSPKQVEANRMLGGPATNNLLRGGSRSGKTFLLVRACVIRAARARDTRHAIFRHRRNHIRESIWRDTLPKVMRTCFPNLQYGTNETDLTMTFPNSSELILGGLDDKERIEKILGNEYATIYLNEASQIGWDSVETVMSRLAQASELALKLYIDCNPPSKNHWTHKVFREGLKPGTTEKLTGFPHDYAEMRVNPADNPFLPAKYLEILSNMSAAKRLRFEAGEWASEVQGALWTFENLDKHRKAKPKDGEKEQRFQRVVVAVDPSGTKGDGAGDDIGIIVVGKGMDGRAYVLADWTCQLSPAAWARRAVEAYHFFKADRIVAERNFGGAMVESTIRTADAKVPVKLVTASRGKTARAEPVAALYEQGKVSHVGSFPELEDQMCEFTTDGYVGETSPDRADALVWALTELMITGSTYNLRNAV